MSGIRRDLSALAMLIVLISLTISGRAMVSVEPDLPGIVSTSPEGYQPIRASVIDDAPSRYTLDIRKFSNIGVDEAAPSFALYITNNLPSKCGDFRDLDLNLRAIDKYKRVMNLNGHENVLKALDVFGCIIIRNSDIKAIPPAL